MARSKFSNETLPYAPVQPLPPTDATAWTPCDKQRLTWRLGNRASVEEITGEKDLARHKWRFRVAAIGGATGIHANLQAAMREAEMALGMGEMPIRLPEITSGKQKGGVA